MASELSLTRTALGILGQQPSHRTVRLSDLRSKLAQIGINGLQTLPEMLVAVRVKARQVLDTEKIEEIFFAEPGVAGRVALLADEIFAKAGSPVTLVTQPTGGLFGNNQSSASVPNQPQPSPAAAPAVPAVPLAQLKAAHLQIFGAVKSRDLGTESEQRAQVVRDFYQAHLSVPGLASEFSAFAAQEVLRHPQPTGFARTVRNDRQSKINQMFATPQNK